MQKTIKYKVFYSLWLVFIFLFFLFPFIASRLLGESLANYVMFPVELGIILFGVAAFLQVLSTIVKKRFILILVNLLAVLSVVAGIIVVAEIFLNKTPNNNTGLSGSPVEMKYKCTRKERYKNPPEFERALSLYNQRQVEKWVRQGGNVKDLTIISNCIVVEYSDISNEINAEGYFVFDESEADANYLPIYVDPKYKSYDDVATAVLLSHEIAHAAQFTAYLNGEDKLNCFEKEIQAYYAQNDFIYGSLNNEERLSLSAREQRTDNSQVEFVSELNSLWSEANAKCRNNIECRDAYFKKGIEDWVYLTYREQCSGKDF